MTPAQLKDFLTLHPELGNTANAVACIDALEAEIAVLNARLHEVDTAAKRQFLIDNCLMAELAELDNAERG